MYCLPVVVRPAVLFSVPELPQPPQNLTVLKVTFDSVKLAWNSTVSTTTTAPVKSYVVRYRQCNSTSDDYVEISVLKPEILVGGLSAQTAYEFHVLTVNDVGQSPSATSIVMTTRREGQAAIILFLLFNFYKLGQYLKVRSQIIGS